MMNLKKMKERAEKLGRECDNVLIEMETDGARKLVEYMIWKDERFWKRVAEAADFPYSAFTYENPGRLDGTELLEVNEDAGQVDIKEGKEEREREEVGTSQR